VRVLVEKNGEWSVACVDGECVKKTLEKSVIDL